MKNFAESIWNSLYSVQWFTVLIDHNWRIPVFVFQVIEQFIQSPWSRVILHPQAALFEYQHHIRLPSKLKKYDIFLLS